MDSHISEGTEHRWQMGECHFKSPPNRIIPSPCTKYYSWRVKTRGKTWGRLELYRFYGWNQILLLIHSQRRTWHSNRCYFVILPTCFPVREHRYSSECFQCLLDVLWNTLEMHLSRKHGFLKNWGLNYKSCVLFSIVEIFYTISAAH